MRIVVGTIFTVGVMALSGEGLQGQRKAPAVASRPTQSWRGTILGQVTPAEKVKLLGCFDRTEKVNPKERLLQPKPRWVAKVDKQGRFQLTNLPEGTYDLVIVTTDGARYEGYHLKLARAHEELQEGLATQFEREDESEEQELTEQDVEIDKNGNVIIKKKPKKKKREIPERIEKILTDHIGKMRLYENRHRPLRMIGNEKQAAVLMELIRDRKTSYDANNPYGGPVATMRYEIWTFTNWYGGWTRDRQVKVLHRVIMARKDLPKQTWQWESSLGGLVVKKDGKPPRVVFKIPAKPDPKKGLAGHVKP